MESSAYALGNAQLEEVRVAAELLYDNLTYLSELLPFPTHISGVGVSHDYGGISYTLRPAGSGSEVRLIKRFDSDKGQLMLEIRPGRHDLPGGLEFTWENDQYRGVYDRVATDIAEPNADVLKLGLAALSQLNHEFHEDVGTKIKFRAVLLALAMSGGHEFFRDEVDITFLAKDIRKLSFKADGGELEMLYNPFAAEVVSLIRATHDGMTYTLSNMSDIVAQESSLPALEWANRMIQRLRRDLVLHR